ncbi:MAG: hypothetical protein DRJ97_04920 [Thermoprotei archaeon]|nr:MAG: hypothetical protein DRJ97_04920 [Thermoprotei archaeon]
MLDWGTIGVLIARGFEVLEDIINTLLVQTLFKAKPELASQFSGPLSLLVSLTALYLLLTLVAAARKAIGILLALGWGLLALAIVLTSLPTP